MTTRADVILMDLRMRTMGGVEAITRLRELGHPARVLILTTYNTDPDVLPAIKACRLCRRPGRRPRMGAHRAICTESNLGLDAPRAKSR